MIVVHPVANYTDDEMERNFAGHSTSLQAVMAAMTSLLYFVDLEAVVPGNFRNIPFSEEAK